LDEDFLEMATEEINLGLVPLIQRMHEEHLVYSVDIVLERDVIRYPIPARAHGNKLRDVYLVDENNNVYDMHRYSLGDISDFSSTTSYVNNRGFYLENNDIVLSNFETTVSQKLRVYFYMRPNSLVVVDRSVTISTIAISTEQDNINPASGVISSISAASEAVVTSPAHGLLNGNKLIISGSNSTPSIDGVRTVSVIDANTFSVPVVTTVAGSAGGWVLGIDVKTIAFTKTPSIFSVDERFDIVQHVSPNKIIHYDIPANSLDQVSHTISFPASLVPNIVRGDYITLAEETIVPNIPTELHPLLAQRVAIACLEAMGDEANKVSAERKLREMEMNANTFLDNRVEGAQVKIKSKNSPLTSTLNTLGRRNRRW